MPKDAAEILQALGISQTRYHIFLCCDQSKAKCCNHDDGNTSWQFLKSRLKELGLDKTVQRSKANCLRVCAQGPIAVVYPQGIWYHSCTPEVLENIIQNHFCNDNPVTENQLWPIPSKPLTTSVKKA